MPSSNPTLALARLEQKIRMAEQELADAERNLELLRGAYEELELVISAGHKRQTLTETIRAILSEYPRPWSAPELADAVTKRHCPIHGVNPDATLRTALCRLKKAGVIELAARGRYRIVQNEQPQ